MPTIRLQKSNAHNIIRNSRTHDLACAFVVTARIRRMGEGAVFSLFVSPHLYGGGGEGVLRPSVDGGGGLPQPGLDGGGVLWPGLEGGGVPWPGLDGGGYPSQVWMVGGGTPARSGW